MQPAQTGRKPAFGSQPARDARFTVVESWAECANFPEGHPERALEFFNRQMNEELNVLENAARSLVEFPDTDWQLRMYLARQCSDEARHVSTYRRLLEERGGRVGQFPVMNFQYRILSQIDQLVGRLAVQNRTFEADGLDAAVFGAESARKEGDFPLALVYEAQQADEVLHVRFANDWIKEHVAKHPISMLQMASAMSRAAEQFQKVFSGGGTGVTKYGVDQKARGEAGFSEQELKVAAEQAELRRQKALRAQAAASAGS